MGRGGGVEQIGDQAACHIGLLRERVEACIVPLKARIDRAVDKRRASHPLPQAAFIHSSGSPALRNPSNRVGSFGVPDCSNLTVSLGLRRRASAKAVLASSILPSSA